MKTHSTLRLAALLCTLPLCASAATRTWDGGGANANWSNAVNWAADTAPVPGDALVFPVGALQQISVNDFPAGTAFVSLSVASAYQLSGNGATLSGGVACSALSGTALVLLPVKLSAPQSVSTSSVGALRLGDVDTNGQTVTFSVGTGGIEAGVISGTGGVTKSGAGVLTLPAANSYSGVTTIQTGSVAVSRASPLGASGAGAGNTIVAAGAELTLASAGDFSCAEELSLSGTLRKTGSGTHTLTGNIVLTGTATNVLPNAQTEKLVLTGVLSGSGRLTVNSGGGSAGGSAFTVRLAGTAANTFTGGTAAAKHRAV